MRRVRLDKDKDVFYDIVFDICDNCNGPIIGVKRYERQNPNNPYDEKSTELSVDDIELYSTKTK